MILAMAWFTSYQIFQRHPGEGTYRITATEDEGDGVLNITTQGCGSKPFRRVLFRHNFIFAVVAAVFLCVIFLGISSLNRISKDDYLGKCLDRHVESASDR